MRTCVLNQHDEITYMFTLIGFSILINIIEVDNQKTYMHFIL